MKSNGFDTVDEYEKMKAARTTFITPDESRESSVRYAEKKRQS